MMVKVKKNLVKKAQKIKLLLLDVDGVLTNGKIYLDEQGREIKAFDIHDGQGIALLQTAGIPVGIISGRFSKAVEVRARQLSIQEVHQGVVDKTQAYEEIIKKYNIKDDEAAYIGDDLIDLPLFRRVGLSVGVANAHPAVKDHADWITKHNGGAGAVREVADFILKSQGKWSKLVKA